MTTIMWDALRAFHAVAQCGSFTKAAAILGADKSKVSRDVRAFEQSLGTTLLLRSTRAVRMTLDGEELLRRCAPHIAALDEALTSASDRALLPQGEVTLATTPDLGRTLIAPTLVRFRARYPAVRVRVLLGHQKQDLLSEGVDLALRVGRPDGDDLIARKVGDLAAGFFAAPAYLSRRGVPQARDELARHDGLWPTPPKKRGSFMPDEPPPPSAIECADFGLLAEVARTGGGIALLPTYLAEREVRIGALVRVLPDVELRDAPLYLVMRRQKPIAPRIAALRAFLLEARLLD